MRRYQSLILVALAAVAVTGMGALAIYLKSNRAAMRPAEMARQAQGRATSPSQAATKDLEILRPEQLHDSLPNPNSSPSQPTLPKVTVENVAGQLGQQLKDNPNDDDAQFNLGSVYYQGGRYQEALEPLQTIVRKHPDDTDAHYILGNTYHKLDRHKEAAEEFKQVARLEPKNSTAYYNLGNEYTHLGKLKEAAESYQQAVNLEPKNAPTRLNLALIYLRLQDDQRALEECRQAVSLSPNYGEARYVLGLIYLKNGNREESLAQYNAIKGSQPDLARDLYEKINKAGSNSP